MKTKLYLLLLIILINSGLSDAQIYCTPNSYCFSGDQITYVSFSNINRYSGCDNGNGYSLIAAPVGNVTQGNTYSLSVNSGYYDAVVAWIDYNHDYYFDNSEIVLN